MQEIAGMLLSPPLATAWLLLVALAVVLVAIRMLLRDVLSSSRLHLVIVSAAITAGFWLWSEGRHESEQRILAERAFLLESQAWAGESGLTCLGATNNETLRGACEHALFRSHQTLAAAEQYTEAQIDVVLTGLQLGALNPMLRQVLDRFREALAQDPFAIVAHVLTSRKGCTPTRCDLLTQLGNPTAVVANLRDRAFERRVERLGAPTEARSNESRSAPSAADPIATGGAAPAAQFKPLGPQYSLPSAASIPPISIMNDEPQATTGGNAPHDPPEASRADLSVPSSRVPRQKPARTPWPPQRPFSSSPEVQHGGRH